MKDVKKEIFEILKRSNKTLSFVESFTGGGLSKDFVSLPGASSVFKGGMVAYLDETKINLGVDEKLIKEFTAVDDQVAIQMSKKGTEYFKSDFCLATTGWAGPDGGTAANPVGIVYFAVCGNGIETVVRRTFSKCNDRMSFMELAIEDAWKVLLKVLEETLKV